jgi:hypothetical protein
MLTITIAAIAVGCGKPFSEKTLANVEHTPAVAGPPDVRWYKKKPNALVFAISTAEELAGLAQIVNGTLEGKSARDNFFGKTIRLTANIDLSVYEDWVPIGSYGYDSISVFSGTFDGGGHVISKVNFLHPLFKAIKENRPCNNSCSYGYNYLGLFGYIRSGRIENLGLDSVDIDNFGFGSEYVGGIAGRISDGSIIANSYSSGRIFAGGNAIGGVTGYLDKNSNLVNSYFIGEIKGIRNIGGVAGIIDSSSIANCYSNGVIDGSENVGGVVGLVKNHSRVISCYSTSSINGWDKIGGVAGEVSGKSKVTDCVALNPALTGRGKSVRRMVGVLEDAVLSNNSAHTGMENNDGYTHWPKDKGAEAKNGADITAAELLADGTLGGRFRGTWTTENGKLPGLRGKTAEFLPHLHREEMLDTRWYTAKPKATNFTISTASDLAGLAQIVNGTWGGEPEIDNFRDRTITLAGDIDLSRYENWVSIGTYYNRFSGIFDGGGHVISKLTIKGPNKKNRDFQGLFGYIRYGRVENLGIEDVNIICYHNNVGIVVGRIDGGSIANSYSTGIVSCSRGYNQVGGIAGFVSESSIANSYSTATVSGSSYVGGIAGEVYKGSVINSYSTGTVNGNRNIGGIVGSIESGSVANCNALNPDVNFYINKNDIYYTVAGRVVGKNYHGTLSNNAAYAGMKDEFGYSSWSNKGANNLDGTDITAEEIQSGASFDGDQFTAENGWTTKEGYLPGLHGKTVEMPEHLKK